MRISTDCRTLLDAIALPVVLMEADGRIALCNREAKRILSGADPVQIGDLLQDREQQALFLRTARRNGRFAHLTLHLKSPLDTFYMATSRVRQEGQKGGGFLAELLPRQLAVGGMHQLSALMHHTADLRRRRAAAEQSARAALSEACKDPLTGIANRRAFDEWLEDLLQDQKRALPFSLLFVDLDYFKRINDTHGHDVGDRVLQRVARLLSGALSRRGGRLAWIGGEEFAVLLPGADVHAGLNVAWRLVMALRDFNRSCPAGESWQPVTVSVGVATREAGSPWTRHDLLRASDSSLYLAKQRGRDQAVHAALSGRAGLPLSPMPAGKR